MPAILGDRAVWSPLQALVRDIDDRVCSPALRCVQTALALWPEGSSPRLDDSLWEQDFGAHEGLPFAEIPDIGQLTAEELADHRTPGGESFADMAARHRPSLESLARRVRDHGPVVVVAHAGTVRSAIALAIGSVPAALAFEVAPWSVTRLRAHEAGLSVIASNWRPL